VSDQLTPVEEIWVNVAEGAEITGYHPDHVRRLARENVRLPEEQRFIRISKDVHGYSIWLPDLMSYLKRGNPFENPISNQQSVEEIWVNTREGAEKTGYNRQYVKLLAMKTWRQPEKERLIQIRKRSNGFELWLPDLAEYISNNGRGPYQKKSPK
jgi:hypothetical protein